LFHPVRNIEPGWMTRTVVSTPVSAVKPASHFSDQVRQWRGEFRSRSRTLAARDHT
jgi:hypothetical protein